MIFFVQRESLENDEGERKCSLVRLGQEKTWLQSVPIGKKITIHHLTKHCILE
jgi:hypothetical protein